MTGGDVRTESRLFDPEDGTPPRLQTRTGHYGEPLLGRLGNVPNWIGSEWQDVQVVKTSGMAMLTAPSTVAPRDCSRGGKCAVDQCHKCGAIFQSTPVSAIETPTITPERAADLTRACAEVDFDWRAEPEKKYTAKLWRNSEYHYGSGATTLAAVLNAHEAADKVDTEEAADAQNFRDTIDRECKP